MANVLMAFNNRADAATLADGSWNASYPLSNLKVGDISDVARSSNAAVGSTRFRADLTANYTLRALALAQHNLSLSAAWRVRAGTSPFDVDFSTGAGDSRITYSGGANGTAFNENGTLAAATAPRFDYDPAAYENGFLHSEDLVQGFTGAGTSAVVLDAQTVLFQTASAKVYQAASPGLQLFAGNYIMSADVRLPPGGGDGSFKFTLDDGGGAVNGTETHVATARWQRFSSVLAVGTDNMAASAGLRKQVAAGTLQIRAIQIARGSAARPYRKTTTLRLFQCHGLLVEAQRTNLLLRSAEFDNASWTKSATTVTANQTAAPDGATAGDDIVATATTAVHYVAQSVSVTASNDYTASFFVKARTGTATHVQIFYDNGAAVGGFMNVRLSDGAITRAAGAAGAGTNVSGGVIAAGGGWYRVYITAQHTGTTGRSGLVLLNTANAAAGFTPSIAMTTSDSIGVWGGQLELGNQPSSHIPTTTASVTRTVDAASVSGATFTGFHVAGAGTLYAEFAVRAYGVASTTNVGASLSDGTNNNTITLHVRTSDNLKVGDMRNGGVNQASQSGGTYAWGGTFTKVAIAYDTNNVQAAGDGTSASALDTSATLPSMSRLEIGRRGDGAAPVNGWVKRVTYWPYRITDAELLTLTTTGPGALDLDTGWLRALQLGFADDTPSDWGTRGYNAMVVFDARRARYVSVDIIDTANSDGYVQLGRLFVGGGFQSATNAGYGDYQEGRSDMSSAVEAVSGKKFGTARRRKKRAAITFQRLTQDEANLVHELQDLVGTVSEVLLVTDPDDMARSQRYGGLGLLSELSALDYPDVDTRATGFQWEEKL